MTQRHVIGVALDLARMPTLARASVAPPLPADILEIIRIAAAHPRSCQSAAAMTGEKTPVLIEAARFYLQQVLFRPDADSYRILGIGRTASRATARDHMRWLLQWLHPDHNGTWDSVYAERVLKAWREVSAGSENDKPVVIASGTVKKRRGTAPSNGLPWIKLPDKESRGWLTWLVPTSLVFLFVMVLWSTWQYFGMEPTAAMSPLQ